MGVPTSKPILMIVDPIGGVWNYALELCRGLLQADIAVCLAVMGRRLSATERAAAQSIAAEVFESDFKLEWMQDPWPDVAAAGEWLLDLESRVKPSLVHLNGYTHGAVRWQAPCLIVGHSCVYSWFESVRHKAPPAEWHRYKEAVMAGLRGAKSVTAPSQFMLSQLIKHYGEFSAAEPVYNGRAHGGLRPLGKERFVLTAGRLWDPAKNITNLASAAAQIAWPIYAAGAASGPDGSEIKLDGLQLLGELDPMVLSRWYGRAAVFASPARYEPFGLAALEAALSGCALLLGDIPSLREIWADAALFVAPEDSEDIARSLTRLITDANLWAKLATAARARALEFSPERMTRGYLALYEQLLSAAPEIIADPPSGVPLEP
ncbi:MAG TPA: glycosyltransferase [Candidatus Binatia bacterium]